MLEVREFDLDTPIFMVEYQHYDREGPLSAWGDAGPAVPLLATLKEQHLLLKLLRRNSKRIESTYQPTGRETAKGFELSFLLPVGYASQI